MSIWVVLMIAIAWYLLGYVIDQVRKRYFPAASDWGALLTWFIFLLAPIGFVVIAA